MAVRAIRLRSDGSLGVRCEACRQPSATLCARHWAPSARCGARAGRNQTSSFGRGLVLPFKTMTRGTQRPDLRIPVKRSPVPVANRSPVKTQTDHLSERNDAGRNHESRLSVRVDGRCRFRIESPFRSSLYALCTRRSRIASASVGAPMTSCHLSTGSWLVTTVERTPWRSSSRSWRFSAVKGASLRLPGALHDGCGDADDVDQGVERGAVRRQAEGLHDSAASHHRRNRVSADRPSGGDAVLPTHQPALRARSDDSDQQPELRQLGRRLWRPRDRQRGPRPDPASRDDDQHPGRFVSTERQTQVGVVKPVSGKRSISSCALRPDRAAGPGGDDGGGSGNPVWSEGEPSGRAVRVAGRELSTGR